MKSGTNGYYLSILGREGEMVGSVFEMWGVVRTLAGRDFRGNRVKGLKRLRFCVGGDWCGNRLKTDCVPEGCGSCGMLRGSSVVGDWLSVIGVRLLRIGLQVVGGGLRRNVWQWGSL